MVHSSRILPRPGWRKYCFRGAGVHLWGGGVKHQLETYWYVSNRRNTSQSDQTGNYCLLSLPELHAVTLLGCRTTHGSRFWMCLGWKLADPAPIDSFTVVACGRKDPGRAMQEPTCRKDIPSQRENQRDQGALGSISGGTPRRYAENELQTVR